MNKKLLRPATSDSWSNNAVAGGEHSAPYAYVVGYFEAAEALVAHALSGGTKDTLFFPICFNYRHYVELQLKNLILMSERLYDLTSELGWALGELDEKVGSSLSETHSLERLLRLLSERLALLTEQKLDDRVRALIIELHNIDPSGETFRYPFRKDGTFCIPSTGHFDLQNVSERMSEIDSQLSGIDIWLDMTTDTAISIIRDYGDASQY